MARRNLRKAITAYSGMNSVSTKCVVCRKTIDPGAKKCTECDSYQDWTRHILRYTTVVAAVLGIIPVATIAISLYEIAFGEKSANVSATLIRCSSDQLDIGFANLGEVPAIVSKVAFRSPDTPGLPDKPAIRRTGDPPSPAFLVDPASGARIVSYQLFLGEMQTRFPQFPAEAETCNYHITIDTLQFDLKTKSQERTCECSRS